MSDQQRQAARERTAATLERVDAVLAMPRAQGEPWRVPEPAPGQPSAVPAQTQRRASSVVSTAWVQRQIDNAVDGMTAAMGRFVGQQLNAMRLRVVESERRIAELEARLEDLTR